VTIFQRAAVFNGILFAWLFNPHTGYMAAEDVSSNDVPFVLLREFNKIKTLKL
jgi:hypothetical protein